MRNHQCWTLLLALFTVGQLLAAEPGSVEWGSVTNGLQMSISLERAGRQVQVHEPVSLVVRLKNLSTNETWSFYRAHAAETSPCFSFVITSPTGKDISPKAQPFHGSGHFVDLGPGQSCQARLDLGYLCRFEEIGTYQITVKCSVGNFLNTKRTSVKSAQVISNSLNVSVLERRASPEKDPEGGVPKVGP